MGFIKYFPMHGAPRVCVPCGDNMYDGLFVSLNLCINGNHTVVLDKKKYLRRENNTNKKQGIAILRDIEIRANMCVSKELNTKKMAFRYVKRTNQLSFQTNVQKGTT